MCVKSARCAYIKDIQIYKKKRVGLITSISEYMYLMLNGPYQRTLRAEESLRQGFQTVHKIRSFSKSVMIDSGNYMY